MSAGRILGLLIAVGVVVWLVRSSGVLWRATPEATPAPAEKARAAARASDARSAAAEAATRAPEPSASGVAENMTPEQVRALLGEPDSVDSESSGDGTPRERWTYRAAGKTVIFENGVVARVE